MNFDINHLTFGGEVVLSLALFADVNLVANIIARRPRVVAANALGAAILTVWTLWLFS